MKQSYTSTKKRTTTLQEKIAVYFRFFVVLILMLASISFPAPLKVHANAYGDADGTYDFGGVLSGDNSAELGFSTFSDKFIISNGFAVDGTVLYRNIPSTNEETLIIKAEGGIFCKTFTFKDLGISLIGTPKTKFTKFSLVVKDISGNVLGTHTVNNHEGIEGFNTITQLSTFLNNGTPFSYNGVASLEISYQLGANTNNTVVPSDSLNFENITIANVSAAVPNTTPTVTTSTPASNVTTTGATVGGNITSDGGATITERGIVFATTSNPTTSNSKVATTGTTGVFTANLSGLYANTTYYYRAFATNSAGTSYGSNESFKTLALSSNANLSNLVLSQGTMSPAFAANSTSYTVNVDTNTTTILVTPTKADANATITVNGATVTSGLTSSALSLSVGANTIAVIVTAEDGTTKTYTVTVNRAAPTYTIGTLSDVTLTPLQDNYASSDKDSKTVTISNTGTGNLANLNVVLGGTNANQFDITQPPTTLVAGGNASFTITPKDNLAAGTYTATVTVKATNLTDVTFNVTQVITVAPTYTIGTLSDFTFSPLTDDYTSSDKESKTVTISNTGTGTLANLAVTLSGSNATDFIISQPSATSLNATDSTTFTLVAKDGLATGSYTANVTISADNLAPVTFTITQVINAAPPTLTYSIDPISNQTFTALTAGYVSSDKDSKTLTISNTGTGTLTNLAVTLSGTNTGQFNITQPTATLASGDDTTFTITPKDNLAAGTYTATVTISADNLTPVTFIITQVINATPPALTYSIDPINHQTFAVLTADYVSSDKEAKTVTISNTGTGTLANLAVTLSGSNATDFIISQPSATSLNATDSTTFTLVAKDGLATGSYTANVTISADNLAPVTFTITQMIVDASAPPVYLIDSINHQTFTPLSEGYTSNTQEMKTLTIANSGTADLTNVAVSITGTHANDFSITQPSTSNVTTGDSVTFTVKANDDLVAGTYSAIVTISADHLTPASFTVTQVVNSASIPLTYSIMPVSNQAFAALTAGYASSDKEAKTVIISNTGTDTLNNLAVALSGTHASDFIISQPLVTSLHVGTDTMFTLVPKDGLAAGTYTATVTMTADHLTPVNFTVTQIINSASATITRPDAPTNITAVAANGQATISFDAPNNHGSSAITSYTVHVYANGVKQAPLSKTSLTSPITITGLTNGTAYTFHVVATNATGNSEESVASNSVIPVVSRSGSGSSSSSTTLTTPTAPNTQIIVVDVVDDTNPNTVIAQTEVIRTTENGQVKDAVTYTADKAAEAVQQLANKQTKVSQIILPDSMGIVTETMVNVPQDTISILAAGNTGLSIHTENAKVLVPQSSLQNWMDDLYFRIVPMKESIIKEDIVASAQQNAPLQQLGINTATITVLGHPVTIETNMQSRPVTLTLPLPQNITDEQLQHLIVYIQHSNGTTEVTRGNIVEFSSGVRGVEFTIEHFSVFTLLYAPEAETSTKAPYIHGYSDGTFRPNANVTRAQMASMLARHLTNDDIPVAASSFTDVSASHSAKDAIEFVKATGLFSGTSKETFSPSDSITRAQMAGVVVRWMEQFCTDSTADYCMTDSTGKVFTDVDPSHWAASAIERVSGLGIMTGNTDTTFNPNGALTRAQAVKILNHLFERTALPVTQSMFTDVPATHWAIGEIEAAATEQ